MSDLIPVTQSTQFTPAEQHAVQIGDTRNGKFIGKSDHCRYVWLACNQCGNGCWIELAKGAPKRLVCRVCSYKLRHAALRGPKHGNWKGGVSLSHGYVRIAISLNDFYAPMIHKKPGGRTSYVLEHRLVMAKHLGRCLQDWEIVHHKNGVKTDNRIGNLEIITRGQHHIDHGRGYRDGFLKGLTDGRDAQIKKLSGELSLMKMKLEEFCKTSSLLLIVLA